MKRHDESTSDRLRRMAATDELSVGRGRAEHIAARAFARAVSRPRTRMIAAAIAGSAFAVVSVTGIGAIADQAVPGDSLYAIDRAYESVGRVIGRHPDRTQETLIEALALAQRGERDRAYLHVTTELGVLNDESPYGLEIAAPADEGSEALVADITTTSVVTASSQSTPAAAAAQSAEPAAPEMTSTTAVVAASVEAPAGDPFILALENALRASKLAVDAPDEESTLAASEAVRSVVKLAAGATDTLSGQQAQAAPTLSSSTTSQPASTSTTTKPKTGSSGAGTTTTTTVVTNSSTTTTVPNDSGNTSPGDGEPAGGNSGGSQQGSGSAGGSGTGSTQPPIILPIP